MRTILISALLIIVTLVIYDATIGGNTGMRADVKTRGERIGSSIQAIDP
jgi:hypothetical protein